MAVTQSWSTGELSKSYADGLPSKVENAIRPPGIGSEFESAHRGSCSLANNDKKTTKIKKIKLVNCICSH